MRQIVTDPVQAGLLEAENMLIEKALRTLTFSIVAK